MENKKLKETHCSGGSPLNDGLGGWFDAEKVQPEFITGERHSKNVWGWDGKRVVVVAWCVDINEGYYWSNAYGNVLANLNLMTITTLNIGSR